MSPGSKSEAKVPTRPESLATSARSASDVMPDFSNKVQNSIQSAKRPMPSTEILGRSNMRHGDAFVCTNIRKTTKYLNQVTGTRQNCVANFFIIFIKRD